MKYMGSKRAMLRNGLGELLAQELMGATRFVDLFAGSGAVASHVARRFAVPVLAFDLQLYSVVLTNAVIGRKISFDWKTEWDLWREEASEYASLVLVPRPGKLTRSIVANLREWSTHQAALPVTTAYGGYYFSPEQAVWIDALRMTLPSSDLVRPVALAALIQAASQCAAAPGHTAQPFRPTRSGKRFIQEAWNRNLVLTTERMFKELAGQFARRTGKAEIGDANLVADQLDRNDVAFIDPPYSGVHYSRFYHVLETIARGECGVVSGAGRYPDRILRPKSKFSMKSEAVSALDTLLASIASRAARAIVTFPDHVCSNGLSGNLVRAIAGRYFRVKERGVKSRFSTLGGTSDQRGDEAGRAARRYAKELMLVLDAR